MCSDASTRGDVTSARGTLTVYITYPTSVLGAAIARVLERQYSFRHRYHITISPAVRVANVY